MYGWKTDEDPIFFAADRKEALKYVRKVNADVGYKLFKVSRLRMARNQNPNTVLKTWTTCKRRPRR